MIDEPKMYEVHGRISGKGGREVHGAHVIVWWQHIRERRELGAGHADEDGHYRLRYPVPEHTRGKLLIVVEARARELESPLESELLDAQPDLRVDLSVDPIDTSEWAKLVASIAPLLEGIGLDDLVENEEHQDLTFLSRELGKSPEEIMRVVFAARLGEAYRIPGATFYAFIRKRVPASMPSPLLDASQGFALIDALVRRVASLIFALPDDTMKKTLQDAVSANLVGPHIGAEIDAIVARLRAHRAADLLTQPYVVGKTPLGQLLDAARLAKEKQTAFAAALAGNQQSMREFWRTLGDGSHGFTAAEASSIERTLSLGSFVKNHLPLVDDLLARFASGGLKQLSDLARLTADDWIALVKQTGAPSSIDGAGQAEPAEVFARVVYARVTRAFPTAALASRAAVIVPRNDAQPVQQFFKNNSSLELTRTNLPAYLEQQGDKAWAGINVEQRPAVLDAARRMQRVLKIDPSVDTAETLLGMGLHSATQVTALGRQQFFAEATKAGLTKVQANKVYGAAAQRYGQLVSLYTELNRDAIGIWPKAIGWLGDWNEPTDKAVQRDQSLATLFGSQDYCEVDFCTSVLSPAAYLCDLLLWLRNHRQSGAFPNALAALDARRPDIRQLLLNCPNTDTSLPYIDLVNELLADKISPPADPNSTINPIWKQTSESKTAAELRAAPEYLNQAAYTTLFSANYPHTLPYSTGLDGLRTYLQQSGVLLAQLRKSLLPLAGGSAAQRANVAAERFWMAPHEQDLVTNAHSVTTRAAWNIPAAQDPHAVLAPVPAFLQAASIDYSTLLELLEVQWVKGGIALRIAGIDDTCDTSVQSLAPAPLDDDLLDRAHRFLRLWRHSGYKMWELDLLLRAAAVGSGALGPDALAALGSFRELQNQTRLPADVLLAFYQDIDTASHRDPSGDQTTSLYARIFLNPAVVSTANDPDLEALGSGGVISQPNLSDHLPALQAALGVSATDAQLLFGLTDGQLTLANVSLLYRVSALARACNQSISNLLAVAKLLAPGAASTLAALTLSFASPATTLGFIAQTKAAQQSGLSIDALQYLLTPPPWTTTSQMTTADITAALTTVRAAILNPNGNTVDGSVIAAVAASVHRPGDAGLANDVTAIVLQQLVVPGTATTLVAALEDPAFTAQAGGVFTDITPTNFPDQFLAIQLFDKVALLVRKLHLVAADLSWLLANAAVYGGLDLTALPAAATQPAAALTPLLATLLLIKLARLFTASPPQSTIQSLYDVIGGVAAGTIPDAPGAQAALATITGWPSADITVFASALGLAFPADYKNPSAYDSLRNLEAMAVAAGATAAQLVSWSAPPLDEATAEATASSALGVLKAQHPNNDDWLAVAPTVMDPIRERRSAALQGYLIGQRDGAGNLVYGDANGLFDHFLIDTQMSSCEVTTRVIQAYIAVQIFVERCLMGLEAPGVVADPASDDTWNNWEWMKRYRIWEANRKVFLYPENWLVEAQRPSRTELFEKLEQEAHQNENTVDYLEKIALNYVDRLDEIAHLSVTGTCRDPSTGDIHVIARVPADPPRFYHRVLHDGAWSGWRQIPLDIKAIQAVPAVYRGRLCLFWLDVKVANEPRQALSAPQASSSPPSQDAAKFVTLSVDFSMQRDGEWQPAQRSKGNLFDIPIMSSQQVSDSRAVEGLYTLKVQLAGGGGSSAKSLFVDVFRLHDYSVVDIPFVGIAIPIDSHPEQAVHVGRAVFDGHISDLELRNLEVAINFQDTRLLTHARTTYGPGADPLIELTAPDPDLAPELWLVPKGGALVSNIPGPGALPLMFTATSNVGQDFGPLLLTAQLPYRVLGPSSALAFDPTSYFFYQDNRRCYYVESIPFWWTGSAWSPNAPSDPNGVPFETRYKFHRFYHPYTRLFWHQLGGGGFPALYDRTLQLAPDTIDPSGADVFSFQTQYLPFAPRVDWHQGRPQDNEDPNREILDFSSDAAYGVYNWELFFHLPLYVAERLSQDQRFEDALQWFHYLFDPTRLGPDPAPKRYWIPKPLYSLTSAEILQQRINNLLQLVNQRDPNAVQQVSRWRKDPFNPFLLADQRPVAYMKRVLMSYLDNLIAWADNLFASDSREALSEATLIYVQASEILGPQPVAIVPPKHADDSYDQLEPKLDAFANALVDIENTMGGGGGGNGGGNGMPAPQTFYFKIPSNDKLLGYWTTVADRLFKLRHCQNIHGVTRQLALFDAPIDPGLLIRAQAAGADLGSVLSDLAAPLPNYRFTALYTNASDFVNAVRAYGGALQAAITSSDAAALGLLQQTTAQQLLRDGAQILDWQVEQAERDLDNANAALALAQAKLDFNNSQDFANAWEITGTTLNGVAAVLKVIGAAVTTVGVVAAPIPLFTLGAAGFGGTPVATVTEGGPNAAKAGHLAGITISTFADISALLGSLANTVGQWQRRKDGWVEGAKEADISKTQASAQIAKADLGISIAQANVAKNQEQIDNLQQQIDFLNDKFTNQQLYDWMVGQLADVYFQSYRLAYKLCKQVERCYRFELGIPDSDFIQFGYWDSLRKGLLAGERLNHDLRRMQASYLEKNVRRLELSRFVSLAALDPAALQSLLANGACDFELPESLFDNDYAGHYNRHLVRMSVTVVYPGAGKFDNVKATLRMRSNKVRFDPTAASSADYPETPVGSDPRFAYEYASSSQQIALGNAQDDPGLFTTAISSNVSDPRYLPFENAGAISTWRLEMPAATNELDLSGVGDVVLHLYYTAMSDDGLKSIVEQANLDAAPTSGVKVFSVRNDFAAPAPSAANPYPVAPFDAFTTKPGPTDPDQTLVLTPPALKFPPWTRGRTITVTSLSVVAVGWNPGNFVLEPQAPLPAADVPLTPIAGALQLNFSGGAVAMPPGTPLGKWTFKLRTSAAADFRSISKNDIGDALLFVGYEVS